MSFRVCEGNEGDESKKERTGEREMSFRVCMYDDMICGSYAPSPSYQFCCRYPLCPFVLPTGVTQYTSDCSCCTSLLALFPARSSAPTSFWSLMVFIDYSTVFSPEFTGQRVQILSHDHAHHLECSDCQYQTLFAGVPLSTKH